MLKESGLELDLCTFEQWVSTSLLNLYLYKKAWNKRWGYFLTLSTMFYYRTDTYWLSEIKTHCRTNFWLNEFIISQLLSAAFILFRGNDLIFASLLLCVCFNTSKYPFLYGWKHFKNIKTTSSLYFFNCSFFSFTLWVLSDKNHHTLIIWQKNKKITSVCYKKKQRLYC